ncbi:GAF domain-containing protein [Sinirhodobacter populi]|uniref:GAF domain-containing protein n=1 Tax=Paenirhodobacter populi TaxID=2306993 RepID=A0A443KNP3_9RHOB|nr:GAF domain-containing protein [Sinirhodobacter populi]
MLTSPVSADHHAGMIRRVAMSSAPSRSALAASWSRSLLHHGLEPECRRRPERLSSAALRDRREAARTLLRVATPILDRLAGVVTETGSALMLGLADGLIVEERLRDADRPMFGEVGLTTGARWAEADEGTNGIGTALAERRAMVIWRDQHFHNRNLALTCMSAPIEAPGGGNAGVIDISSCRRDLSEGQARLIALTVQDAAIRIGSELFRLAHPDARLVTLATDPHSGPCLIAVDDSDLIVSCNRAARRMLRLSAEDIARHPPFADLMRQDRARGDIAGAVRSEVVRALKRSGGNVTLAALDLRIGRSTLYRKIKSLGLTGHLKS